MAERVIVVKLDDLSGREGDDIETVRFSINGSAYEIDLSAANRKAFHKAVEKFVDVARRDRGMATRPKRRNSSADLNAVREWARSNGYEVSDRGRVPARIMEAFSAAR